VSYPDQDEVRRILEPHEETLMGLHLKAWDRLMSNPDWPTLVFASTGSKLMHDFVVQEAAQVLDETPGFHKIGYDNSVRYAVDQRVLFRFKKGNGRGLGSNIDTSANDDFIDAQAETFDMPGAMKVELLWYSNELRTKLDKVVVTARDGKSRLWNYAICEERAIGMLPMDLPQAPVKPAGELVALKPVKKADEEQDD
tara:strand:- start:19069 stop:19659 length:591 start_codon:yes stop_codon:yes gene_type:complete